MPFIFVCWPTNPTPSITVHSLVRLRSEIEKLQTSESSKLSDPTKRSAYLGTRYEEILQDLAVSNRLVLAERPDEGDGETDQEGDGQPRLFDQVTPAARPKLLIGGRWRGKGSCVRGNGLDSIV
jgi:hypothetical protein